MTCAPIYPFGCPITFGPMIGQHYKHCCDRTDGHKGPHKCHCGATNRPKAGQSAPSGLGSDR